MTDSTAQITSLAKAVVDRCSEPQASKNLTDMLAASELWSSWTSYIKSQIADPSDASYRLIDASQRAIVEAIGCNVVGFVRPSILAMRTQYELAYLWLFYRTHPTELKAIETKPDLILSRSEVRKYLDKYNPFFSHRYKLLADNRTRPEEDPYAVLCQHVHANSDVALPVSTSLADLVQEATICAECNEIQTWVAEFLSDTYVSWFPDLWPDLPESIRANVSSRLDAKKLQKLLDQAINHG